MSLGTVSNVLNRPELVRPATRAQVERASAALGYVRNESARQLRAGVSRTLAFVALQAANPFFTDVSRARVDLIGLSDHRQVGDFHLLDLAAGHGLALVTFDRRIPACIPERQRHHVLVL